MLEVEGLDVAYGDFQVLWGVSLRVAEGEMVCLLGPNGAGKSTLLNSISGLVPAKGGQVRFRGQLINGTPTHALPSLGLCHVLERRRVFPHLTVLQNLQLGAYHPQARARREKSLEEVFSLFPVLAERRGQMAGSLSGGEQQMLALGRGLMARPRLLLVDEPFLGLAPEVVQTLAGVLQAINREGTSVLFIEQNVELALSLSQRGYVMESGRMVLEGKGEELLQNEELRKVYLGL